MASSRARKCENDDGTLMLAPGTLLLSEKPFVYALKSQFREQRCDFCFAE